MRKGPEFLFCSITERRCEDVATKEDEWIEVAQGFECRAKTSCSSYRFFCPALNIVHVIKVQNSEHLIFFHVRWCCGCHFLVRENTPDPPTDRKIKMQRANLHFSTNTRERARLHANTHKLQVIRLFINRGLKPGILPLYGNAQD